MFVQTSNSGTIKSLIALTFIIILSSCAAPNNKTNSFTPVGMEEPRGACQSGYDTEECLLERANRGNARANYLLFDKYMQSSNSQIRAKGHDHLLRAVVLKYPDALYAAAIFYEPDSKLDLLEDAATQGHQKAQYYLALELFQKGDHNQGMRWLSETSANGYVGAHRMLADIYSTGAYGVQQNNREALRLYGLAADNDDPEALDELANFYMNGTEVGKNPRKAFLLRERSANLGYLRAIEKLAAHYLSGIGTVESVVSACEWALVARSLGSQNSHIDNLWRSCDKNLGNANHHIVKTKASNKLRLFDDQSN